MGSANFTFMTMKISQLNKCPTLDLGSTRKAIAPPLRQFSRLPDCLRFSYANGTSRHRRSTTNASQLDAGKEQSPVPPPLEAIDRADYGKFVRYLHLASPYVVGHRSRTFVVVLPGEVMLRKERLARFLEDIMLLHGLGVRLILVAGAKELIDQALTKAGRDTQQEGAYRVTDADTMRIAIETAGTISTEISAQLSRAPSIPMMRRHSRGEGKFHFAPAVQVVSGNYVTAKRRGIVNGVDYGYMGQVRFVQKDALSTQLDAGNIVLLNNVGVSASGELLNCNAFDVATHAAVELQADKLLCLTGADVKKLKLPHYLPLDDAEILIRTTTACAPDDEECDQVQGSIDWAGKGRIFSGDDGEDVGDEEDDDDNSSTAQFWHTLSKNRGPNTNGYNGNSNGTAKLSSTSNGLTNGSGSPQPVEMLLDLDGWQQIGFPKAVLASVVACRNGVNRAHLIDMDVDGAMLLELYTRDGVNGVCMIAADLYEGIRPAEMMDAPGISRLLLLLAEEGHQLPFPAETAGDYLGRITVIEREGRVLACACCDDLGVAPDGVRTAEISALVVDPSYRRQGLGDSLLDYVEQNLRRQGFRRVVLVAERGSYEWFGQRAFEAAGDAAQSQLIPKRRAAQVPAIAKLFTKSMLELDASLDAPAGKRIGF